ncbi:MAG: hypothetical protein JWN17_2128 [Frankiales bacterium]|nr:hypothetical protein [Frankiales bacterium]
MTVLTLPACPSAGEAAGWSVEPGPAGGPLLVVLSGLAPEGQEPAFEGRGLCRRLGVNGLLLRDHSRSWFLRGVRGTGDDLEAVAAAVRAHVAATAPSRVVLMGNSAGGYAAIALASLLEEVDEVVALVPRSGLTHEVNDALGDDRFSSLRAAAVEGLPASAEPFLDLPTLLTDRFAARCTDGRPPYRTRVRVLHASDNALDAAHAARLAGLPETVVSTYPRGDHQLASVLRTAGELDVVVGAALTGPRVRGPLSRTA